MQGLRAACIAERIAVLELLGSCGEWLELERARAQRIPSRGMAPLTAHAPPELLVKLEETHTRTPQDGYIAA